MQHSHLSHCPLWSSEKEQEYKIGSKLNQNTNHSKMTSNLKSCEVLCILLSTCKERISKKVSVAYIHSPNIVIIANNNFMKLLFFFSEWCTKRKFLALESTGHQPFASGEKANAYANGNGELP